MRIEDVNLGNGLFRLDVRPTSCCENVQRVPTHVMDNIMRDVIARRNGSTTSRCACTTTQPRDAWGRFAPKNANPWSMNHCGSNARVATPTRTVATNRVPTTNPCMADGITAVIDKPKREMYGGPAANWGFQQDMKKYRAAEKAIKACDWPAMNPPNYNGLGGVNAPRVATRPVVKPTPCCAWDDDFIPFEDDLRDVEVHVIFR